MDANSGPGQAPHRPHRTPDQAGQPEAYPPPEASPPAYSPAYPPAYSPAYPPAYPPRQAYPPAPPTPQAGRAPSEVGSTAHAERSLAPDLARGSVLLFIALANVVSYLYGQPAGLGNRPVDGSAVDRSLDLLVSLFVDQRSYPMFAILLGYGLATMGRRLDERGVLPAARRRVLVRRNLGLLLFGAVHAALLFSGDILGVYALTGLIVMPLLYRRPSTRGAWTAVSLAMLTAFFALEGWASTTVSNEAPPSGYLASAGTRLLEWTLLLVMTTALIVMVGLVLIGVAVSRSGLLDRPWDHVARLRSIALAGLLVNLFLGLPYALAVARVWSPGTGLTVVIAALHGISGIAAGLAYLCLFALLAVRLHGRRAGGTRESVAAVGERSLTCYLFQSLLLAPLLSPWGLGVGGRLGTAGAYGVAVLVWALGVALAVALARSGRRGPAEVLLRRLTYGRRRA